MIYDIRFNDGPMLTVSNSSNTMNAHARARTHKRRARESEKENEKHNNNDIMGLLNVQCGHCGLIFIHSVSLSL